MEIYILVLIAALCFVISIKLILKLIRMNKLEEIDRSDLLEGHVYTDIKWIDNATHLKLIKKDERYLAFEYVKGPHSYAAEEDGTLIFSTTGKGFYKLKDE